MLSATYSLNDCLLLCEVYQKSIRGVLRYLGISAKSVWIMNALKTGLNGEKFVTFWMFPKRFYDSFVLQMTLLHSTSRWTQVHLRDSETHESG